MTKIVTHNGKFHTDDVFGVATLFLLLGKDQCEVVRTRDEGLITSGDFVLDVGEIYDPDTKRFDHHQVGGAGKRDNSIEYASFGLIWKHYGQALCSSKAVADKIEAILVQGIDAADNGQDIVQPIIPGLFPFSIQAVLDTFRPTWKEEPNWDEQFMQCVEWAQNFLKREIKIIEDDIEAIHIVENEYQKAEDKKIILIGDEYDLGREIVMHVLVSHIEPIYAVLHRKDTETWQVLAIRKDMNSYESRKSLPQAWGAKHDKELEEISGVKGALFCHRRGFMCLASTKEGALKLAQIALQS